MSRIFRKDELSAANDKNFLFVPNRASCKSMSVVRQAHHERERWFDRLTMNGIIKIPFTLSRELAERSKGVFGVLPEAQPNDD